MSVPGLVAKGCTLDLSLDGRKPISFCRLGGGSLHVMPTPPSQPPPQPTRHRSLHSHAPLTSSALAQSQFTLPSPPSDITPSGGGSIGPGLGMSHSVLLRKRSSGGGGGSRGSGSSAGGGRRMVGSIGSAGMTMTATTLTLDSNLVRNSNMNNVVNGCSSHQAVRSRLEPEERPASENCDGDDEDDEDMTNDEYMKPSAHIRHKQSPSPLTNKISPDLSSTDGRKSKRRKKNGHRKNKSKHRLRSKGSAHKESESAINVPPSSATSANSNASKLLSPYTLAAAATATSSPTLQALCAPVKIGQQPKRPDKPKVEYIHMRAKSQPEKIPRSKSISNAVPAFVTDDPAEQQNRVSMSASAESLSRSSHSQARTAAKTISPYYVLPATKSNLKPQQTTDVVKRFTKIYLSDKQSKNVKELGMEVPMAPPCTPRPDPSTEYVASLADVRSQRAVKDRLSVLKCAERERAEQQQEVKDRNARQAQAEQRRQRRQLQRKQVYALNAVMKENENKNFKEFCMKNAIMQPPT